MRQLGLRQIHPDMIKVGMLVRNQMNGCLRQIKEIGPREGAVSLVRLATYGRHIDGFVVHPTRTITTYAVWNYETKRLSTHRSSDTMTWVGGTLRIVQAKFYAPSF